MNMPPRRTSLAVLAVLALLALAGCTPEPGPSPSETPAPTSPAPSGTAPTPTTTPTPSATPTPTPTADASSDCERIVASAAVEAAAGADLTLLGPDWSPYDVIPGTAAEASESTTAQVLCVWGTGDQPVVSVMVAELPAAAHDVLLREVSGTVYFEDQLDGADAFSRNLETDGPSAVTHLLDGETWIVVTGAITVEDSRSLAGDVLAATR